MSIDEDAPGGVSAGRGPLVGRGQRARRVLTAFGLPLAAGVLAAFAFPPLHLLPVLPVAFLILLRVIERARTVRGAALAGFAFGLGLHTAGLYWLTNAVLIRASEFWWFVPFASPGCALILAPFAAVPAALCKLVPAGWRRALLLAGTWTLCDMARLFLFSGFTWNPLGSDWAFHGLPGDILIQPAAWIGVDGLTLVTVLLATLLPLGSRAALICGLVMVLWLGAGWARFAAMGYVMAEAAPRQASPVVVLVQGNVPETEKMGRGDARTVFERYLRLTRTGVEDGLAQGGAGQGVGRSVVYVWPETAFPGLLEEDSLARGMIARSAGGASAGIIGTVRAAPDGHWRNAVVAIGEEGQVEAVYDKARLVPFGEYQPPHLPLQIVPGGGMTPGPGPQSWRLPGLPEAGPLICYEVIFSGHVVDEKDRPSWLVNVTNDAWFGNSAGPRQHLSSVRLRAVEEGLPVARAANTGISIVYDGRGHEIGRLPWGVEGTLVRILPPPLPVTLFARLGQGVAAILSLLVIALALYPFPRRPRRATEG